MPQGESDPHPARTYPSAILTQVLLVFITAVTRRSSNIPDIPILNRTRSSMHRRSPWPHPPSSH